MGSNLYEEEPLSQPKRKTMSARDFLKRTESPKTKTSENAQMSKSGYGTSLDSSPSMLQRAKDDSLIQDEEKLDHMDRSCIPKGSLDKQDGSLKRSCANSRCVACKKKEPLLYCAGKGCNKAYHLSCLDPPISDDPPGQWLCFCCLRKKMESVYTISRGIEAVLDYKKETGGEQHYFVKYKGLADIHNKWIPEGKLCKENPALLYKFQKKLENNQLSKWKHEWTEPHRLLKKRFIIPPEKDDECTCQHRNDSDFCYGEWFVKWKGLGYEYATWELENSSFLFSTMGSALINDYERRLQESRANFGCSETEKVSWVKKNPFCKYTRLPEGCPSELNDDYLDSLNSLLGFWHKSQHAVLIEDQGRISKAVLFIMTLQSYKCRPFLIICTSASILKWESEFSRFSASVNVVVYDGTIDDRKMIQKVEFYEESGCILFQVLLADISALIEDFDALDCIGWEAIIVDNCQNPGVSKHFEQFKNLSTDFRLLLLKKPVKENTADYLNILSLLDPPQESRVKRLKVDRSGRNNPLDILKERLGRYIACDHREESVFTEYWVPVHLSYVQLVQYCQLLKSQSEYLSLCLRDDDVDVLLDTLISIRKCCSHPYLADKDLQAELIKGQWVECLGIGVNACGKLKFLQKMLQEMRNRKLRVLILCQSNFGSGRDSMLPILGDILKESFGADSYVDVNETLKPAEKCDALKKFNEAKGQFIVLLIETQACRPSIKLSSVDVVFIYDNNFNPIKDLKALQKMSISPECSEIKVFRLYSPFTLEEKTLYLAKQGTPIQGLLGSIKTKLRHSLLGWGASHLFSKFDELNEFDSSSNHDKSIIDYISVDDVLNLLIPSLANVDSSGKRKHSKIVEAQQDRTSYSSTISLIGEKENISLLDKSSEDIALFWSKLFKSSSLKCKFASGPAERTRKRPIYFGEEEPDDESWKDAKVQQESAQRRKKTIKTALVQARLQELEKEDQAALPIESPVSLPLSSGAQDSAEDIRTSRGPLPRTMVSVETREESSEMQEVIPNGGVKDMPKEPTGMCASSVHKPDQVKSTISQKDTGLLSGPFSCSGAKPPVSTAVRGESTEVAEIKPDIPPKHIESSGKLPDIPATVLCESSGYKCQEVASTNSQKDNLIAACEKQNTFSTDAGTPVADIESEMGAYTNPTRAKFSSLQSILDIPFSAPNPELHGRINDDSSGQVPILCETRRDQTFISTQNTAIPSPNSGNEQIIRGVHTSQALQTLDPTLFQTPQATSSRTFVPSPVVGPSLQVPSSQPPVSEANHFPSLSLAHLAQVLDPFDYQLALMSAEDIKVTNDHEAKKAQLQTEFKQELEKLKLKYASLMQNANTDFIDKKKKLEEYSTCIINNKHLAELLSTEFFNRATATPSSSQGSPSTSIQPARHLTPPGVTTPLAAVSTPSAQNVPVTPLTIQNGVWRSPAVKPPAVTTPLARVCTPSSQNVVLAPATTQDRVPMNPAFRLNSGSYPHSTLAPRMQAPHLGRFRVPNNQT